MSADGGTVELDFRLQRQQGRAFLSEATELLYGGAAGGGKSHLLRIAAISWCMEIPGIQGYLFRRTFPELKQNHMEGPTSFPVLLAPLINAGRARIVGNEIRFPNRSRIFLRHCQHEKDVYAYQGTEFHFLMIDELTHWPESMYRYLRGRCRITGIRLPAKYAGMFPRIMCGTNPGNIGHHWVKAGFIDHGALKIRTTEKEEGGMKRQFIPARLEDNPALRNSDPDYEKRLEGLGNPLLVRAMREGDWDVVAGSQFGGVWRKTRHICRPFPIPVGWKIWRGADDGFASPAACYWLTQNTDTKTIYVIRELYRAGMLPDEYAERTLAGDRAIERAAHDEITMNTEPISGIMDSAAFADTGTGDGRQKVQSRGAQMNAAGCRWKPAEKPPGSRVHGVQNMHRLLSTKGKNEGEEKPPGLVFFDTCTQAIRTIPTLPADPHNPEDVDTEADDHAFDGVRYGLQWVTGGGFKKRPVSGL